MSSGLRSSARAKSPGRSRRVSSRDSHAGSARESGRGEPQEPERRVDPHGVLRLDSPPLRHEPVELLDASLGVEAVAAHVPLADGAVGAGRGIGAAHDADEQVAPAQARLAPGSKTRPRDSWPSTRRALPGGAQPYFPSAISTSVPQTPTAIASTRTDPSRASGSGTSSRRAVPALFGCTVIAFMQSAFGRAGTRLFGSSTCRLLARGRC
jgi:hypothetical protein